MSPVADRSLTRLAVFCTLAVLALTGCAGKKAWYGDPEKGLNLEYRFTNAKPLSYRMTNTFKQTLDIMGQTMEVDADGETAFTVSSEGAAKDIYTLDVAIDAASFAIKSMGGNIEPDMSELAGKRFAMTLTLLGKELDVSGAEELTYDMGPQGTGNMSSQFQAVFPDLPGRAVAVGDTWTSSDTVRDKSENSESTIMLHNTHTIDGFETVNGMECVRIRNAFTGSLAGKGQQQGMDLVSKATIEGTETWYFAYKKGVFVRTVSTGSAKGTIVGSGMQEITIPMTRKFEMTAELLAE